MYQATLPYDVEELDPSKYTGNEFKVQYALRILRVDRQDVTTIAERTGLTPVTVRNILRKLDGQASDEQPAGKQLVEKELERNMEDVSRETEQAEVVGTDSATNYRQPSLFDLPDTEQAKSIYLMVFKRYPPNDKLFLLQVALDLAKEQGYRESLEEWRAQGYNPQNISGILGYIRQKYTPKKEKITCLMPE